MTLKRRQLLLSSAALLPLPSLALAQNKPVIRLLVGFPAGGATDAIARVVADRLPSLLGQPVIVDNKGGAATAIGATAAANAPVAGNATLSALTQVSYTNLSSRNFTTSTSAQTSGTYTLLLADLTLTASGAVATFRYVDIYDDTPTSPADPLMCWFDYAGDVTMANGETFLIDFTTSTHTIT